MRSRAFLSWSIISVVLLTLMLLPFFLYDEQIVTHTHTFLHHGYSQWVVALVLGTLLAADVFLPVPSSLVSTACGSVLGLVAGTCVSWIGMTAGCALGYGVGLKAGRPTVLRLAGTAEALRVERAAERYGRGILVLFRAVPVLAEVSVMFAGISRMPVRWFLLDVSLANLGISITYAALGSQAVERGSFLLVLFAAVFVPLLPWLASKWLRV